MTTVQIWFLGLILAFALVLSVGVTAHSEGQPEIERYEKTWCKGTSGMLEACAIKIGD